MLRRTRVLVALFAVLVTGARTACAADSVTLGTDWRAQAEHGGYYQALATGLYEKAGLDVTIRQGGPQVNHSQLLAAGRLDFSAVPNSFIPLNFVAQNIPVVAVAAIFQKDPAVLIAHAGQGHDTLADLKGEKIMISPDTRIGFWRFLKAKYGFTDDQIAPYTFNLAPFLSNPRAIQQGLLSSEPFQIERTGKKPVVMLLADSGYTSYSSVIMTSQANVDGNPDLVRRFVQASIQGWLSYLTADPTPAHDLIKKDNPDMSGALLAFGRGKLIEHAMITAGDAETMGIGAMTDARWRAFFETMVQDGLYPSTMDYRKAFTTAFVDSAAAADKSK